MKQMHKKIVDICKWIFGYGIMIVLFAGGLTFFGYVVALIIGGDTATEICTWLYKSCIPIIVYASTVLIVFGLITMYISGEKALVPDKGKKKQE